MNFLAMPKVLIASGFATMSVVTFAQYIWPAVPIAVLLALATLSLGGNILVGLYVRYREIKGAADCQDVRRELTESQQAIDKMKRDLQGAQDAIQGVVEDRDRWRTLYREARQAVAEADRESLRRKNEPG